MKRKGYEQSTRAQSLCARRSNTRLDSRVLTSHDSLRRRIQSSDYDGRIRDKFLDYSFRGLDHTHRTLGSRNLSKGFAASREDALQSVIVESTRPMERDDLPQAVTYSHSCTNTQIFEHSERSQRQ